MIDITAKLKQGTFKLVSNESHIKIWEDNRIPNNPDFKVVPRNNQIPQLYFNTMVQDLIIHGINQLNNNLICNMSDNPTSKNILAL